MFIFTVFMAALIASMTLAGLLPAGLQNSPAKLAPAGIPRAANPIPVPADFGMPILPRHHKKIKNGGVKAKNITAAQGTQVAQQVAAKASGKPDQFASE